MSTGWRVAGFGLAAIAFAATVTGHSPSNDLFANLPLIVQALINAASVFIAVWVYEGVYHVLRRVGRALFPAQPQSRDER